MGDRWGNSGNSVRLYFLGSKITADGDYSHEIKRRLLLGRKVMTNLDSIFKSRDITLLTKVRLVKAMVFPVVVAQRLKRLPGFDTWVGKIPWRRKWQPTPVFLPGESHGGRHLVGYSPWGCKELDMTEQLYYLLTYLCMDMRVGLLRRLSAEELMLLNCGVGEDS